jgi:hypothetical protein
MSDVTRTIGLRVEIETAPANAADKVKEKVADIGKEAEKTSTKTKKASSEMAAGLKGLQDQAAALPGPIGNIAQALGGVREGVNAFSGALQTLRGRIIATGIGLLAVILGSIAAYFSSSEKAGQQFNVMMAYLGGVMKGVMNIVEAFGGLFVNMFTDPIGALKEFGNSFLNFGETVSKATTALVAYEEKMHAVKLAERELIVERAKANRELAEARLIANDATQSTEDRIKAVQKAAQIEEQVAAKEKKIAQDKLDAINVKINATGKETELLDERARAEANIAELETANFTRRKKLETDLTGLKKEEQDKRDAIAKEAADRAKQLAEQELANLRAIEDAKIALLESAYMRERETARVNLERKIADIKGEGAEETELRALLLQQRNKALADIDQKEREARAASALKIAEKQVAIEADIAKYTEEAAALSREEMMQREIDAAVAAEKLKAETLSITVNQLNLDADAKQAERDAIEQAMVANQMRAENDIRKKYYEEDQKLAAEIADEKLKKEEEVATAKRNMAITLAQQTIGIARLVSKAMGDNAEVAKGIATAEVWINAAVATASAISKAVQSSATPYDIIANIAVAVGTVAGAIASTIEILNKADIPGGTNGPVGSMPSFTATAPTGTPVSTNVTGLVNTQQAELQPIQAFVVETQITGAQGNVEQIYGQASFGLGG